MLFRFYSIATPREIGSTNSEHHHHHHDCHQGRAGFGVGGGSRQDYWKGFVWVVNGGVETHRTARPQQRVVMVVSSSNWGGVVVVNRGSNQFKTKNIFDSGWQRFCCCGRRRWNTARGNEMEINRIKGIVSTRVTGQLFTAPLLS